MASSWPTTRSWRRSSIWMSLAVSPSMRRLTGMPVQAADDLGDVVGADLLLEQRARALQRGERRLLARRAGR